MSYSKKITVLIFIIITIAIFGLFSLLFSLDIQYHTVSFSDITVEIPAGLSLADYEKDGWIGKEGFNRSRSRWIYCLRREGSPSRRMESYLPKKHTYRAWMLGDVCFGVVARGKGYRRYVYLFSHGEHTYWLEGGSSASSLIQVKEAADTMLTTIRVAGMKPIQEPGRIASLASERLPFSITQSFTFFIILTVGILIFTYAVVWIISMVSTREPKAYAVTPHRIIRGVTVKISLKPLGVQMQDGLVAISGRNLAIYLFGKQAAVIPADEFADPARVKRGRTAILKQPYLVFTFPETTEITLPGRKRQTAAKKITLYMNGDEIDAVVREMGLPIYEYYPSG
jgi:hypothetical protein